MPSDLSQKIKDINKQKEASEQKAPRIAMTKEEAEKFPKFPPFPEVIFRATLPSYLKIAIASMIALQIVAIVLLLMGF